MELSPEEQEFGDELIEWVSTTLGIDLKSKLADDDWTAVVKLHAMIETALNTTLLTLLRYPELARVIQKLDTSNTATGKVAFAKAMGILSKESANFIQKLSEMRNFCVHDIRNFDFTFDKYVEQLAEDDRIGLRKVIDKEVIPEAREMHLGNKLMAATMGVMMQLRNYYYRHQTQEIQAEIYRRKAALYDEQNPPTPKGE